MAKFSRLLLGARSGWTGQGCRLRGFETDCRRKTRCGPPGIRVSFRCTPLAKKTRKTGQLETPMKNPLPSRRAVLKGSAAWLAGSAFSTRVLANAPPPEPVTQALIDAAKKEGQVAYYPSTDLPVAEKLAKAFEAKYPGIAVRTERTGARGGFQG